MYPYLSLSIPIISYPPLITNIGPLSLYALTHSYSPILTPFNPHQPPVNSYPPHNHPYLPSSIPNFSHPPLITNIDPFPILSPTNKLRFRQTLLTPSEENSSSFGNEEKRKITLHRMNSICLLSTELFPYFASNYSIRIESHITSNYCKHKFIAFCLGRLTTAITHSNTERTKSYKIEQKSLRKGLYHHVCKRICPHIFARHQDKL